MKLEKNSEKVIPVSLNQTLQAQTRQLLWSTHESKLSMHSTYKLQSHLYDTLSCTKKYLYITYEIFHKYLKTFFLLIHLLNIKYRNFRNYKDVNRKFPPREELKLRSERKIWSLASFSMVTRGISITLSFPSPNLSPNLFWLGTELRGHSTLFFINYYQLCVYLNVMLTHII